MKKVIIPVIAALFVLSVVFVAFFGTKPTTDGETIYCDYIVCNLKDIGEGKILKVDTIEHPEQKQKYEYSIKLYKPSYIFGQSGEIFLDCAPMTNQKDKKVTKKELNYFVPEEDQEYVTINTSGTLKLSEKVKEFESPKGFEFTVSSTDGTNIRMTIKMVINYYN